MHFYSHSAQHQQCFFDIWIPDLKLMQTGKRIILVENDLLRFIPASQGEQLRDGRDDMCGLECRRSEQIYCDFEHLQFIIDHYSVLEYSEQLWFLNCANSSCRTENRLFHFTSARYSYSVQSLSLVRQRDNCSFQLCFSISSPSNFCTIRESSLMVDCPCCTRSSSDRQILLSLLLRNPAYFSSYPANSLAILSISSLKTATYCCRST